MTISTNDARDEYTSGAGQTVFNYTFKIYANTELNVYVTPVGQAANDITDITTAYTVTGVGLDAGGTITLTTAANLGDLITIVSNTPSNRTTDYQNNGDFLPTTVNADFDRVVSISKKIEDLSNRSVLLPQSQQGSKPLSLPVPSASQFLKWNTAGTGLINALFPEILIAIPGNIKFITSVGAMIAQNTLNIGDRVTTFTYNADVVQQWEVVAAATGTDDGGTYIDLTGSGHQAKQIFSHVGISVLEYGAYGDGATNDYSFIKNAIDACSTKLGGVARTPVAKVVRFPFKVNGYRITTPLNLTSDNGQANRRSIKLTGEATTSGDWKLGTKIVGHTSGKAIIEVVDNDSFQLENLQLTDIDYLGSTTGGASIGVYQARRTGGTAPALWTGDCKYHRVVINFENDDITRNSNFGTLGFVNIAGEETTWSECEAWCNSPLVLSWSNSFRKSVDALTPTTYDSFAYTPVHATVGDITTGASNTVFRTNDCRWIATGRNAPTVLLHEVGSYHSHGDFLQKRNNAIGVHGSNGTAYECWNVFNIVIDATTESTKTPFLFHRQAGAVEAIVRGSESGAQAAKLRGAVVDDNASNLAIFNAITDGAFVIYIDTVFAQITALNFSTATNLSDVAATIQTALRAVGTGGYTLATCTHDGTRFFITSGTVGSTSDISYLSAPGVGTDISSTMLMRNGQATKANGLLATAVGLIHYAIDAPSFECENSKFNVDYAGTISDGFISYAHPSGVGALEPAQVTLINSKFQINKDSATATVDPKILYKSQNAQFEFSDLSMNADTGKIKIPINEQSMGVPGTVHTLATLTMPPIIAGLANFSATVMASLHVSTAKNAGSGSATSMGIDVKWQMTRDLTPTTTVVVNASYNALIASTNVPGNDLTGLTLAQTVTGNSTVDLKITATQTGVDQAADFVTGGEIVIGYSGGYSTAPTLAFP